MGWGKEEAMSFRSVEQVKGGLSAGEVERVEEGRREIRRNELEGKGD